MVRLTVRGMHPELFEEVIVSAYRSKTHLARSMRIAAMKYEEVTKGPLNKSLVRSHESGTLTSSQDFWSGGNGILLERHVNPNAEVAGVGIANRVEKR